jgi:hypothetical protein
VEVKSLVEDFGADRKWTDNPMRCDRLFFAAAATMPLDIFRNMPDCLLPTATALSLCTRSRHAGFMPTPAS